MKNKIRLLPRIVCAQMLCLTVFINVGSSYAQEPLSLPEWRDIFDPAGNTRDAVDVSGTPGSNGIRDYVDLYSALDAVFAGDNISNSVATDMSVSDEAQLLVDTVVRNDMVIAAHDVGNAFIMAKIDNGGDFILFGGVERLAPVSENSYIEFEFNQQVVQAIAVEVPLRGERTEGDLLVRMELTQGVLAAASIKKWNSAGEYETITPVQISGGVACSGDTFTYVVCDPWQASGQHNYQTDFESWTEGWDLEGNPVTVPQPNAILEFGVNVSQLLGASPDYTSIVVRTPKDIILDGFRHIGHWAQLHTVSN